MTQDKRQQNDEVARLQRKFDRERRARLEAETLLEEKSSQLYDANQKLAAEAERARLLVTAVENASDGIAVTDPNGQFVFMNKAHANMFGYLISELIGEAWSVLYDPKELRRFDRKIMPVFQEQGFWRGETRGLSKSGKFVFQEVVLTGLSNGGLICATRDISIRRGAQQQARELEQRLQKAEQEAALFTIGNAVAHDFNNLIGAISGYATLIQSEVSPDSEAHNFAERISQASDQAAGVIRSLEVERSNDTITMGEVDIAAISQTGLSIAEAIRPAGIEIDIEMPDVANVYANEVAISRALMNITKNAFEAMGTRGELKFRIAKTPSDTFAQRTGYFTLGNAEAAYDWIIEISDTGPGLRQDKLEKIFDPFYTAKKGLKGSGLGLLSLTSLVETDTAFVEVISQLDYGTQFRLNIKIPPADQRTSAPAEPVLDTTSAEPNAERQHILIVEDEAMMGEVIAKTLKKMGYSCDLFHDPVKALQTVQDPHYRTDLMLTDLTMPSLRGDELASQVKSLRPKLPIIIYSGQAAYIEPSSNYADILRKPIVADELRAALEAALV